MEGYFSVLGELLVRNVVLRCLELTDPFSSLIRLVAQ